MKNFILSLSFLTVSGLAFGQQAPQFTQFMQTGALFNPGMTGINSSPDIKIGYRKQWAGLPNSPSTLFASGSVKFGTDVPIPTVSLPVRGRLSNQFQTSAQGSDVKPGKFRHALGAFIIADQTSPTALNIGNLSYALHIALNSKWNLSVGAGLSVSQTSLNRDKLNVSVKDDAGIGTGLNSKINPDLNAGAFLSSETFFIGYSANYLFRNDIYSLSDKSTLVGKQKAHHYGVLGFRFDLNENWNLSPAAMIKFVDGSPLSSDVYCRFNYKDVLWFGPGFRNQDAFSGFLGVYLSNLLSVSYAYDYNYSSLNTASNGSHEVVLGLRLIKNNVKTSRPSMW